MNKSPKGATSSNPWNGLRTYTEGEIIYGRNEEIKAISILIQQSNQVVIYGKSGIGKSSIINAGVFPIMRERGIFPVYIRLDHSSHLSYLQQIKSAVAEVVAGSNGQISVIELTEPTENESLWEYFHRHEYESETGDKLKPLIVFDQFEEIFTLGTDRAQIDKFFIQLADLINNVMPEDFLGKETDEFKESNNDETDNSLMPDLGFDLLGDISYAYKQESDYHLVFILREDFLSYLERNTTKIPALKNYRYCLQPINEEQAAEIIMQPRHGLVKNDVAKKIIEKVTGESNFKLDGIPEISVDSAILSLYLSRLYDKMVSEGNSMITAELVETHSANIIEDFYNDAISDLSPESVNWLEDTLINEDGRRDNRDRSTVLRESGLNAQKLDYLVNTVKLLRQFSYGNNLRVEFIHDVLCPVIVSRRQKRDEQHRIEKIKRIAKLEKKRNKRRMLILVISAAILLSATAAILYIDYWRTEKEFSEYYSEFTFKNGWPAGVGAPLTKHDIETTPLYYKLSKYGSASDVYTKVTIESSVGELPFNTPHLKIFDMGNASFVDTIANNFAEDLSRVSELNFIKGTNDLIGRVSALDKNGDPIFFMSYFHLNRNPNGIAWVSFHTPEGDEKRLNKNGIDRVKITWDSIGNITSYKYYDAMRIPQSLDSIYGRRFKYISGDTIDKIDVDEFGSPYKSLHSNATRRIYDNNRRITENRLYDNDINDSRAIKDINGVWKIEEVGDSSVYYFNPQDQSEKVLQIAERDNYGRVIKRVAYGSTQGVIPFTEYYRYSDIINAPVFIEKLEDIAGTPWTSPTDTIYKTIYAYEKGSDGSIVITKEEHFTPKHRVFLRSKENKNNETLIAYENIFTSTPLNFTKIIDNCDSVTTEYFDKNKVPYNRNIEFYQDQMQEAHRLVAKRLKNGSETLYYVLDKDNNLTLLPYSTDVNGVTISVSSKFETKDSNGNTTTLIFYNENGEICKSMMYQYTDGRLSSRSAMGIDGTPVRSEDWEIESFGYYKMNIIPKDSKNIPIAVRVTNEFDDAGALYDPYPTKTGNYVQWVFGQQNLGDEYYLDKLGKKVLIAQQKPFYYYTSMDDKNISNQKVAYAHILSKKSAAYKNGKGVIDGDRIIGIDSWSYDINNISLTGLDNALARLDKPGIHTISVLRPDPKDKRYTRHTYKIDTTVDKLLMNVYKYNLRNNEVESFRKSLDNEK